MRKDKVSLLKNIAIPFYATALFTLCYITYAWQGADMPWGRVDPIVHLALISEANARFFPEFLYFDANRPLGLVFYLIVIKSPFVGGGVWFLWKSLLIFLAGLGLFLTIRELTNRKEFWIPALTALLFVVYPSGGWEKLNQVQIGSQYSMASMFMSYYLALLAMRLTGWRNTLAAISSFLLSLNGFFMYEVAAFLSVGLCAVIFMKNGWGGIKKSAKYSALLLAAPFLAVIYKVALFSSIQIIEMSYPLVHATLSKGKLLLDPAALFLKLMDGFKLSFIAAWKEPFSILNSHYGQTHPWLVWLFGLSLKAIIASIIGLALVVIVHALFLAARRQPLPEKVKISIAMALAGGVFAILGYVPTLVALIYPFDKLGRIHDYATPGISLLFISVITLGSSLLGKYGRSYIAVAVGALVLTGAVQYMAMERSLCSQWRHERPVWKDILKQAPSLKSDTIVVIRGYEPPYNTQDVESYYFSIVLASMHHDSTLRLLLLPKDFVFERVGADLSLPTRIRLSEFRDSEILLQKNQGMNEKWRYLLQPYNIERLRRPLTVNKIPIERVVTFDYDNGKTVLNASLSNMERISLISSTDNIFTTHFMGEKRTSGGKDAYVGRHDDLWMGEHLSIHSRHPNLDIKIESYHATEVDIKTNDSAKPSVKIKPGINVVRLSGTPWGKNIYIYNIECDTLFKAPGDQRRITLRALTASPSSADNILANHSMGAKEISKGEEVYVGRHDDLWMGEHLSIHSRHPYLDIKIESYHATEVDITTNDPAKPSVKIKPGINVIRLTGTHSGKDGYVYNIECGAILKAPGDSRRITLRALSASPVTNPH